MRLTTVILIASLIQVSAATFAQRITLNQRNTPLESVFKEIRKQSGYDFFYDGKAIKPNQRVSISVTDVSVEDALRSVLKDLPFTYEINDNRITIRKKEEPSFLDKVKPAFDPIDVHGRVVDESNKPVAGATVKTKDGKQATLTDVQGVFILKNVNEGTEMLISFIGYNPKEVLAAKDLEIIQLQVATSKLDEVQIQAYSITSRRLSTSNISTIKAKDIENQPVNNPMLALTGRIPGLQIAQTNGMPGSSINIKIQGLNSINAGNAPFYVLNGVPYISQSLPTTNGGPLNTLGNIPGEGGSINPLSFINPNDIESIDILKDADATAIYGSRAANGAILITTKSGKAGKLKADFNAQSGWGQVTSRMKLLNTEQYLIMRREAKANDNAGLGSTDYDLNGAWGNINQYTDWQKVLLGHTSNYKNFNGNLSGGSQTVSFLIGGFYRYENSVFSENLSDRKGGVNLNLNTNSSNKKFKLSFTANYLADQNKLPRLDLTSTALTLAPNAPGLYNPDGTLNWQLNSSGASTFLNPLVNITSPYRANSQSLVSSSNISYQIIPELRILSNFGYNRLQIDEYSPAPSSTVPPADRVIYTRVADFSNSAQSSWIVEPQLQFNKHIEKIGIDFLVGSTLQRTSGIGQTIHGSGFISDQTMESLLNAQNITIENDVYNKYSYNALFGKLNLNIDDTYILNFSARRDGSSRFGTNNLFHNFAAAGAAWIFSNENLVKDNLKFLSFGKIRLSYGTSGNDQIPDYSTLSLFQAAPGTYQDAKGVYVNSLANPYLQWEETTKISFGLDLGFFNDRLLLNGNYARNRSSNQLLGYSLPAMTGFSSITSNFPAKIQNTSLEFSLNSTNIKRQRFHWTTNLNVTIGRNKLLEFPNLSQSSYANTLIIGQPISIQRLYKFHGVDPSTGEYTFLDKSGNITTSPNYSTDQISFFDNTPRFYGGFQNSLTFGNLTLDVFFQFVKQKGVDLGMGGISIPGAKRMNQPLYVLDRWQKPGDQASVQRFNSNSALLGTYFNMKGSDAVIGDASYIRLKNIALGYELPLKYAQRLGVSQMKVTVSAQNILTFTNYKGLDPESGAYSLPPLKLIALGINISL